MKRALRITVWSILSIILLLAVIVGWRYTGAAAAVAAYEQTVPIVLGDIGVTEHLTILPLFENATRDQALNTGHGVAYLVRTDATSILMDTGFNPDNLDPSPLEQNMARLGVTLDDFDTIYITHPHPDHVGGVAQWLNRTFSLGVAQTDLSDKQILTPIPMTYSNANPQAAGAPRILAPGVATLGAIPFVDIFPLSLFRPQMIEEVLVVNVADVGVILITGCGHPGLERMVRIAEATLGQPVVGVVGGLHYGETVTDDVQNGIALLRARNAKLVSLSPHDTGSAGLAAFAAAFPQAYYTVAVGEAIVVR
jgi:7,8-dihydropterin-6-yl-methyl-4-(beta-D-ribofuranosyl)aminobenzene 5'-phosphate synthase